MVDIRDAEITRYAVSGSLEKRIMCPECDHYLPVTGWTECKQCGAHLSLKWEVEAPGQNL